MKVWSFKVLGACVLALAASTLVLGDTIRLKNGSVIRGQVVGFRDEQFIILLEPTARGRRNRMQVYVEDVESIEFDGMGSAAAADTVGDQPQPNERQQTASAPSSRTPAGEPRMQGGNTQTPANTSPANTSPGNTSASAPQPAPAAGGQFFPVRVRVRADNTANGWTDSGLMVRKGQRLRFSASGRVSLGQGRFSTPTGLPRISDNEKLMRSEPTGGLIAVIGDDNDEFIFIGAGREFYATRDGRLFLGVNDGNLADNSGSYDALIEAEPVTSGQLRP